MQEELCDSFVIVRVMRVAAAATLLQTKLRAAPEDRVRLIHSSSPPSALELGSCFTVYLSRLFVNLS